MNFLYRHLKINNNQKNHVGIWFKFYYFFRTFVGMGKQLIGKEEGNELQMQ